MQQNRFRLGASQVHLLVLGYMYCNQWHIYLGFQKRVDPPVRPLPSIPSSPLEIGPP